MKLVRVEEKTDCTQYKEFLEENLLEASKDVSLRRRLTIKQDRDPEHHVEATLRRFKENQLNVLK